jgi:uncharacterized protein YndB with AHSA1/START domain
MMATVKEQFSITRTFNASKQQVFDAFSHAEALAQWWGPVNMPIDVIKLDFRPQGIFHYCMKGAGEPRYGIFHYVTIEAPNKIEWINSFANEAGEIIQAPFPGLIFPKEIMNIMTLTEEEAVTTLHLTGYPINASEEEENTYYSMFASMNQGFTGTLDQLENYLKKAI